MSRLVVVSNRVAVPENDGAMPAGGLAVAVSAALENRKGVWFGWSGKVSEEEPKGLELIDTESALYALQGLCRTDYDRYYNGYCNRVLWPLFHYRLDLMKFDEEEMEAYLRVNRLFAKRLNELVAPDDVIWVHDYHLMPLARILKACGVRNRIGFFLHIPCPSPDMLAALPHHHEIVGALADYDLVGFQTETDRENFERYLHCHGGGRMTRTGAFPVGIETSTFSSQAVKSDQEDAVREIRESLSGRKLIIGVDRLDYSKGIPNRLEAFECLLEHQPHWQGKVTYLQIAPKSRSAIPEYAEMDRFISMRTGQINGRFSSPSWTPVRYVNRNFARETLAGLYRAADIGLVTPFRDGMNLVAKEFLAAQDEADPGVLVLSELAGAASELSPAALMVNPYDATAIARALDAGLRMSTPERQERLAKVLPGLRQNDITAWSGRYLKALEEPAMPRRRTIERLMRPEQPKANGTALNGTDMVLTSPIPSPITNPRH